MTPPDNPLSLPDDALLYDMQVTLAVGCGRNKAILHGTRKGHLCYLGTLLALEAERRGKASPAPPYRA